MIRSIAFLTTALALFVAPVAAPAADIPLSTLRLAILGDPHTMNPLFTTEADEAMVVGIMFEGLVEFDSKNAPQPVLAATVPTLGNRGISPDGKTIAFHLRHGVKWHDGAPFSSADVVFTVHAVLDEKNAVANRVLYENIASVEAPNADTVVFHLKERESSFLSDVASGYGILPEHLLGKSANLATDPFNAQPVGTGPYTFVRWQRAERIELAANPAYYGGVPKIARISVSIVPDINTMGIQLRNHELDLARVDSAIFEQLRDVPGLVRRPEPANALVAVALNRTRPLLADPQVRLAVVKAIDRKRLVQTVSFGTGTPAYADLPLFMYGGHPPAGWDDPDPAGARAILDRAGWKTGANGLRAKDGVPLRLLYIDYAGSASAANADVQIIQMLKDVGIDVEYKTFAPSLYFAPVAQGGAFMGGNYDLGSFGWRGGTSTANSPLFSCATRTPNGFNAAKYCNPAMERLQAAERDEYDTGKRNRIVAQIEDLAVKDGTYAFLY